MRANLPPLRPFQSTALERASSAFRSGAHSVLLVSPPGTGKTRTAVEACVNHRERAGVPMFVAPRRELVTQAENTLRAGGMTPERDCFIRTIQSLTAAGAVVPPATLIVLDEARHYSSPTWSSIREMLPKAWLLGLDGTPERPDGIGLGGMFDVLVEAISVREAIAGGFLVRPELMTPGRFLPPGELARDPVDAVVEFAGERSTMVFLPSVASARDAADSLQSRDIRAAAVWGDMPEAERIDALARYASGDVQVLTNANLLVEGVDVPRTSCIVLARGFGTPGPFIQAVARAMRPRSGKTDALIVDLRGVSHIHGAPDAARVWSLEGRACRRPEDSVDVRFCPVCGSVVVANSCEECGHAGEMRKRAPKILGLPMQRFAVLRQETDEARVRRLSRWLATARDRGWREGQALHRFKGAYGAWPSSDIVRRAKEIA